jgi:hypothetical protein
VYRHVLYLKGPGAVQAYETPLDISQTLMYNPSRTQTR